MALCADKAGREAATPDGSAEPEQAGGGKTFVSCDQSDSVRATEQSMLFLVECVAAAATLLSCLQVWRRKKVSGLGVLPSQGKMHAPTRSLRCAASRAALRSPSPSAAPRGNTLFEVVDRDYIEERWALEHTRALVRKGAGRAHRTITLQHP